jgi:hypothetical protein
VGGAGQLQSPDPLSGRDAPVTKTFAEVFRDAFAQMNAGTISPAQFFEPDHLGAIVAGE